VLLRCEAVAAAGAIPLLMRLCAGSEGFSADAPEGDAKGKSKGKKKAKKAKPEPGMEEAQTYGAGCLRLLSLEDEHKEEMMAAGAPRCLPQLVESKLQAARWHARQTLLNLAMVPAHATVMTRFGLPDYITGSNIPAHFAHPALKSEEAPIIAAAS